MTSSPFLMEPFEHPNFVHGGLGLLQGFRLIEGGFHNPGRAIVRETQAKCEAISAGEILLDEIIEAEV